MDPIITTILSDLSEILGPGTHVDSGVTLLLRSCTVRGKEMREQVAPVVLIQGIHLIVCALAK